MSMSRIKEKNKNSQLPRPKGRGLDNSGFPTQELIRLSEGLKNFELRNTETNTSECFSSSEPCKAQS